MINRYTNEKTPTIHSTSAILMDASTGEILFEKDTETAYPVASISKLMTIFIVLDHIEAGSMDWDDLVPVSRSANDVIEYAAKIPVNNGTMLTVHDLFHAMVISSANNATIALTEYIAGSEMEFTKLMNEKASVLGLSDRTNFINSTGLPNGTVENRMSAKDIAILTQQLLNAHPEILETTSLEHYFISSFGIDLYNTNRMLDKQDRAAYFKGVDGLKTGYTDEAGYCFVSTATQKNGRLISVVLNAETDEQRFDETKKLLSYLVYPSF